MGVTLLLPAAFIEHHVGGAVGSLSLRVEAGSVWAAGEEEERGQ